MSQAQVFQSFNEQLACIAKAGVPLDEGLRLIATEMRSRRAKRAVEKVVTDLQNGQDLSAAFAKQSGSFPELYHQVIEVGIRSGRMSHVLIAFGRHLALIQRFKSQLWRSMAYPVVCLVMLLLVAIFLAIGPVPILGGMSSHLSANNLMPWRPQPKFLPYPLLFMTAVAPAVPWICGAILLAMILAPLAWWLLGAMRGQARFTDAVLFRVPLLGRVLRTSATAQWCDALAICTEAGMPLTESLRLAGRLVGYPSFVKDSEEMAGSLASGLALHAESNGRWRQITPATRMALQLASERQDLPTTSRTLSEMYQNQAESRAQSMAAILAPLLLLAIAALIAITLGALMSPLIQFLRALT